MALPQEPLTQVGTSASKIVDSAVSAMPTFPTVVNGIDTTMRRVPWWVVLGLGAAAAWWISRSGGKRISKILEGGE